VSHLVYPAAVVAQIGQPGDSKWLLPAAVVTVDNASFVLDTGNNRILKLDGGGHPLATFDGSTDPRLSLRQAVAMATDGRRLFVVDSSAPMVLVVDVSGRVEKAIPLPGVAPADKTPRPIGIAVSAGGRIAVSDANNHRVLLLDGDGRLLKAVGTGSRAGGPDGFNVPGNLALDGAGNIYVVDVLNGRVVELSPDGAFVRQFGQPGDTAGMLARPKGVAVDAGGRVFVSDGLKAAIEVFSPSGTYIGMVGRRDPDDPASGSLFVAPAGLWLSGDRLHVVDRFAGLITLKVPAPIP
jgi:sugar lactone lactonase YvrE